MDNIGPLPFPTPSANRPASDRRAFARFKLPVGYTAVRVRLLSEQQFTLDGHAYDISEGGIQFELDLPIDPGTPVAMQIELPRGNGPTETDGPGRAVFILGNVVWLDDSEPGPARMALVITRFARAGDLERLQRRLRSGAYAAAA
jgi:hypothetical protein